MKKKQKCHIKIGDKVKIITGDNKGRFELTNDKIIKLMLEIDKFHLMVKQAGTQLYNHCIGNT